jgi:hypothetical protein
MREGAYIELRSYNPLAASCLRRKRPSRKYVLFYIYFFPRANPPVPPFCIEPFMRTGRRDCSEAIRQLSHPYIHLWTPSSISMQHSHWWITTNLKSTFFLRRKAKSFINRNGAKYLLGASGCPILFCYVISLHSTIFYSLKQDYVVHWWFF